MSLNSIPYYPQQSSLGFNIPKTLAADFKNFLSHDLPDCVGSFLVLDSWYDQFKDDFKEKIIRAEIFPDSTKSRYSNTDNNLNFNTAKDSGIKKGDLVIDEKGIVYLLDWQTAPSPNALCSRALRCNVDVTIKRFHPQITDDRGYLIEPQGYYTIVDKLPSNAYRYDGRPEYSAVAGQPGTTPNALTLMTMQYNEQTKNIHIDDLFDWGNETYIVVDIDLVGLNRLGRGCIKIQAKKEPGGIHNA